MSETPYYGFPKVPDGHMIYGKDLNAVLDAIDEKLHTALTTDKVTVEGAVAALDLTTLADYGTSWTQVVLDDEQEFAFANAVTLDTLRLVANNFTITGGTNAYFALALASAPTTPVSAVITMAADGSFTAAATAGTAVALTEEVILIGAKDVGTTAGSVDLIAALSANVTK